MRNGKVRITVTVIAVEDDGVMLEWEGHMADNQIIPKERRFLGINDTLNFEQDIFVSMGFEAEVPPADHLTIMKEIMQDEAEE